MAGVKGFSKSENQRRYFLHYQIRQKGGKISTLQRIVFIPLNQDVRDPLIIELSRRFGYQVQTEAFPNADPYKE